MSDQPSDPPLPVRDSAFAAQPFRFYDLPPELRNTVYQDLLCMFEDAPSYNKNEPPPQHTQECTYFVRNIHPEILLTKKQIHREAYDIMVKTNRFVRVNIYGALPLLDVMSIMVRRIICRHNHP